MIKFKRLKDNATIPTRAHDDDAGFDLYAAFPSAEEIKSNSYEHPEYGFLSSQEVCLQIGASPWGDPIWRAVPTGIACAIPEGFVGLVCPRSGSAIETGRTIVNAPGIIDSGYRGELKVILHSLVDENIKHGDKIGQLVVVPCLTYAIEVDELDETDRGEKGFGSSGR